ncbi:MAG: S-methyl-5'-thioadenosine phosphorylase [Acidimicrobiia bacterium]|nr:S-methyl-5'-thioadenosine phosphorylase [Acidimicrobiia bacterium]
MLVPAADVDPALRPEIGVIGGSGFYEYLEGAVQVEIDTPFGPPSSPFAIGELAGRQVAFLARHGPAHGFAAHRVPFRANIWALASLGVESIVAPCSVGSLRPELHPGQLVVLDQLVDRTFGRAGTFHDVGSDDGLPGSDGPVHHQTFADPYDEILRRAVLEAGTALPDLSVVDGGTMVVINGPRFSTRAESRWYRAMGWDVVNMTGAPEAALAAEVGIRYASVALVTDYDAGIDGHEPVTLEAVLDMVRRNVHNVRRLIAAAIPAIPAIPAS